MQENGNISISTENMFPIIKKWLYSEKDIFIRELTSNCSDAINKLMRLASVGEYSGTVELSHKITGGEWSTPIDLGEWVAQDCETLWESLGEDGQLYVRVDYIRGLVTEALDAMISFRTESAHVLSIGGKKGGVLSIEYFDDADLRSLAKALSGE